MAAAMGRERYPLDACDLKAITSNNAVTHREFEVLVYTWTARLKRVDHPLDEIKTRYP